MRFGLGPKPGGVARIGSTRSALLNACLKELENPAAALLTDPDVPSFERCCEVAFMTDQAHNLIITPELPARYAKHLEPEVGFVERLVLFWSNHFSVSLRSNNIVWTTAAHMERDIIRKHVLGKFSDMLKGVMEHPAMVVYLNNRESIGPNSPVGRTKRLSFNENLAREILELHTVGSNPFKRLDPRSDPDQNFGKDQQPDYYTQDDVKEFAKILTGWSIYEKDDGPLRGQFRFIDAHHEPGAMTVMGTTFGQPGIEQGRAVLDMLANHPMTAQHIAFKLLRHFVMDRPTPAMVRTLALVFIRTGGDLKAVARALLRLPEAWSTPLDRLRQPHLWLVSQTRALGFDKAQCVALRGDFRSYLEHLNNHPWHCVTPDGYPDRDSAWRSDNGLRIRTHIACDLINKAFKSAYSGPRPRQLARDLLPEAMSAESMSAIEAHASHLSGLPTIFLTPEFLHR
jgi:uncharacterized protein (DUF1800 family)